MIDFRQTRIAAGALASVLVLAGCVSQSKYDDLQTQNTQLQQQVQSLSAENAQMKAAVGRLQGAIKYTVNSDQVFASGSWEMTPRGKRIIAQFAKKLAPTMTNKLVVNGFTDNQPIGPELAAKGVTSNEILSQKRADAVAAFLVSQGVSQDLVSAHGYGEANPVASNATAAGRAKNRRVELALAGS